MKENCQTFKSKFGSEIKQRKGHLLSEQKPRWHSVIYEKTCTLSMLMSWNNIWKRQPFKIDQTDCCRSVGDMFRHNNICNKTEDENRIKQEFELEGQCRSSEKNTQLLWDFSHTVGELQLL